MASAPVVSIITPTFIRARLVRETINSIVSQGMEAFENIVLDDGSADDTEDVVRSYGDARLVYVRHENMGEAATVSRGWRGLPAELQRFARPGTGDLRRALKRSFRRATTARAPAPT